MRVFIRLFMFIASLLSSLVAAPSPVDPAGHWDGIVQVPDRPVAVAVDLWTLPSGQLAGTFAQPSTFAGRGHVEWRACRHLAAGRGVGAPHAGARETLGGCLHDKTPRGARSRDDRRHTVCRWAPRPSRPFPGAVCNVVSQATVNVLPVLSQDDVCLREVHLSDAAALLALFARVEVSAHLDPPPATLDEFGSWIALSQSRRADKRAACFTLLTGNQEVSGLFMALRLDTDHRAEIGFAMSPALWGTGVFQKAVNLYLDFLFNEWGVTTLIGKTLVRNGRGVGAMRKLGAKVVEESVRNGQPEYVWTLERQQST